MSVKLSKKTETVYVARCQWACAKDRDGRDIVPYGLMQEHKRHGAAVDVVNGYAAKTYKLGDETRTYHAWVERVTRYQDGTEESVVVREYNRPAEPELKRFEVTLTKVGERTQYTFTWAATHQEAQARMAETVAQSPDIWGGWTFTVAHELHDVLKEHDGHEVNVGGPHSTLVKTVDASADQDSLKWQYSGFSVYCLGCKTSLSQLWN